MATKKQAAAKPAVKVNTKNKVAPAKKAVPAKVVKTAVKKAAPVKPAAAKKAVVKPVKKAVPIKKSAPAKTKQPMKKTITTVNKSKTETKSKAAPTKKTVVIAKSAPAKKAVPAAPAKKTVPIAKAAPAKKAIPAPPAKKAVPAAKAAPAKKTAPPSKATPAKKVVAPAPKAAQVKKAVPVTKVAPKTAPIKVAPVKATPVKVAPVKAEKAPKKPVIPVKKVFSASSLDKRVLAAKAANTVVTKPMATPAARPTEKKNTVVIAHRRLENKSKNAVSIETPPTYQPEIYRSILDEPAPPPVTVYRYSDEELAEFKELVLTRLEAARKDMLYLQSVVTRKDEAGTEDTENRYMNMEDGSGAMEREQSAQLASRQIQFVNNLEKALIRIENKTYGVCRVTGKLIEKARLRAVPHATLSIEAKKMMNTKSN